MNQQPENTGKYEGRHVKKKPARRISALIVLLLILLCGAARFGAELFKVMAYYDVFFGGNGLLNYGNLNSVDLKDSLNSNGKTIQILDQVPETEPEDDYIVKLQDGTTVIYNGHTYQLNPDLTTILVMGIDKTISEDTVVSGKGGQSDVILLVGLDTKTGNATVLNISREMYAEVETYSGSGNYMETAHLQLTLAYAYGDGRELSCENTVRSVSRLLYGLPISSYVSIDMEGIQAANEAVGGVTVKSLFEGPMHDGIYLHEGDTIELHGKNLERYLRTRNKDLRGNVGRMERHKQYLTEFVKKVVSETRSNLTFPVTLFSALSPYMVTSLTIPNVTFLSSSFLENGAHFSFRTIDGTFDMLNGSAVYYPDELDLFEAVLQVFYLRVD